MLRVANWNVSNGGLNSNMVNITVNGATHNNVPVMIQPGQADETISMAENDSQILVKEHPGIPGERKRLE